MSDKFLYRAFAGGAELVEELNARGVATACLSNTNASHWRIMNDPAEEAHFPLHRLTHRFASHLVRARKPDPAIYEHVERETGIAPPAIVFFDDVVENIEAAIKRGWKARRVDPKSENPIPMIRSELCCLRVL
jgi:putative hydrolase of the HAD superfamily